MDPLILYAISTTLWLVVLTAALRSHRNANELLQDRVQKLEHEVVPMIPLLRQSVRDLEVRLVRAEERDRQTAKLMMDTMESLADSIDDARHEGLAAMKARPNRPTAFERILDDKDE